MPASTALTDLVSGTTIDLRRWCSAPRCRCCGCSRATLVTLFSGHAAAGGEVGATITRMGRSSVEVRWAHTMPSSAKPRARCIWPWACRQRAHGLAGGEGHRAGVASIQPLLTERTVLRLTGERADKKVAHWHSVAVAARGTMRWQPHSRVWPVQTLAAWLEPCPQKPHDARWLLSLALRARPLQQHTAHGVADHTLFLSGPEGGFSAAEEAAAAQYGFAPVTLGLRCCALRRRH